MKYESIIGLEVHIELKTKTKMFCACKNDPDERHPNVNICPICTGQPGTLPVINRSAVNAVIKVGLALKSKINEITKWDRKNYFYPDLPKGYQISQYDYPICLGGELTIPNSAKKISITRVHLEEDTGRLAHFGHIGHSLVDFNRAGVPLMELVTEPDMTSGEEAGAFAQELHLLLRYLGVSDADMEKGQMRIEANLSLKSVGAKELGVKVEVKNLNSFKAVRDAIDYEIKRQTGILENGEKIIQQTRGWNETKGETVLQRIKEESHDYRYFPEPDLPPLNTNMEMIKEIETGLPELPGDKRKRLKSEYGLADEQINILVNNEKLAGFFEDVVSELQELEIGEKKQLTTLSANYILGDFLGLLNEASAEVDDVKIDAENFAELMSLIHKGTITTRAAKDVLKEMWATGKDPNTIVGEKDLRQTQDTGEIEKAVSKVISENQTAVADYKKGKEIALQFLLGQVMAATRGKASPEIIAEILKRLLN
ncbi:glutaminyl-tRNA synthase (glutamine-hydrolyzing) subunit B [Candidatus Azambacteria bacterium RIFOXYC1_FULL_41_20]|nr:MAG: Aspartyl/glutamyl-tRNA(Asn/Gln) amidotransferase subunit B [Candidatus Azambacteria bacterium GW2011_GWF1_41_10]KKS49557.1 MAG: Aspartyl/glutamyl-tRNA(Asn/Gln) amidotransferase subunit B [Candidatus Azambacteria bacterium GW2011_GWF2_42_22]KKT03668.1 MAG: Aspartyl/glutamyl-tRNA(Asn/Gln) amidotransferase subunit B [Candidatus Azambacteria bacterium GW2011_GWD1_43_18]KKT12822.1 MAG: Aspartyl/glutamyl-tRNA(Asn/Gln) amidotransferase subunit B [Candidatus Azambacteria bacterium GW2011_GWC2_43